jgi:hypothetical protein
VRSRDHDSDPFSLECSGPQSSNETNTGQDRVENIAMAVSTFLKMCRIVSRVVAVDIDGGMEDAEGQWLTLSCGTITRLAEFLTNS